MTFRLMWGITGTGYVLKESVDLMKELQERLKEEIDITVMLSKEGEAVVKWYKQWKYLTETVKKVKSEITPNLPFYAGALQIGKYDMFIVCPVSANSVAKIVYGIADTLITNCVAQAIKGGITAYLYPSDQHLEPITTTKPSGEPLVLKIRDVEIENVERLKKLEGIHIYTEFDQIKDSILNAIQSKKIND